MANMIPFSEDKASFHNSTAEEKVYNSLRKFLPDDIYVFHSLDWNEYSKGAKQSVGEADFLLFDQKYGFLSIEVKGGGIKHNIVDDSWYSIDGNKVQHILRRSPMKQAWESAQTFEKRISASDVKLAKEYIIRPVVWFPDLTESQAEELYNSEFTPGNTFTAVDLNDPIAALKRAFANYGVKERDIKLSANDIRQVCSIFAKDLNIVSDLALSDTDRNKVVFNRLTKEQTYLLDIAKEIKHARVKGVGGTGKTMLALELARRIPNDEKILFLCFNKLLLNALRKNWAESMPNVKFASLNELYDEKTGLGENAETNEIATFIRFNLGRNFEYRHIIIDEGQDLEVEYLTQLKTIADKLDGYFYIFYDENQLVHQWNDRNINWFNNSGLPPLNLNRNCRNTFSIAETSYSPMGIQNVELAKEAQGEKPTLKITNDNSKVPQIIGETIQEYTQKGFTKNQITILTVKTLKKTILSDCDSVGGYRLSIDNPDGDNILFTTSRKFKGLESDVIIMIDVDQDCFKDMNAKSVFYVAASRAISNLTIIANLDNAGLARILKDLGVDKAGALKRLLEEALSVNIIRIDEPSKNSVQNTNQHDPLLGKNYPPKLLKWLKSYYFEASDAPAIDPSAIKKYLRSVADLDMPNIDSAIVEASKLPFYDNSSALKFMILYYLSQNNSVLAQNLSNLLRKFVIFAKIDNYEQEDLTSFASKCIDDGLIIIEKRILSGNYYTLNKE